MHHSHYFLIKILLALLVEQSIKIAEYFSTMLLYLGSELEIDRTIAFGLKRTNENHIA